MASIKEFDKALVSLELALREPKNDIVRDATIQRFEYCVELSWKISKKMMASASVAPKVIIREMAQQNLIDDPEKWFEYLEARNLSSYTYKEEIAEKVYGVAKKFLNDAQTLLRKLIIL